VSDAEDRVRALQLELAAFRQTRNWLAAVGTARKLTELEPEDGESWFWLARGLEMTLDLSGALAAYERALTQDFTDSEIREAAEIGLVRVREPVEAAERGQAEREEALRRREEALRAISELVSFRAAMDAAGRAREHGHVEIYVAAASRAVELADSDERRAMALTSQGAALRRAGQVGQAIAALEEAVAIDPSPDTNHRAFTALVAALKEDRQFRRAVPHVERVLALHPEDPYMLWAAVGLFTSIYEESGQASARAQAEEYAERAAKVAPEGRAAGRSLEALARVLEHLGETERAAGVRALLDVLSEPGPRSGRIPF
jgi:tetratricopeptide (TPR) repeat protein